MPITSPPISFQLFGRQSFSLLRSFKVPYRHTNISIQAMAFEQLRPVIHDAIHADAHGLNELSQTIWKNPELNFEEHHAHQVLTDYLEKKGFKVQRSYPLPTAFRADFDHGTGGPTIAVMCEYDALPSIGHACGHNLIAELGVGAAIGIKAAMEKDKEGSFVGKLVVLGTPAEEGGGGKELLIQAGALEGVDFAMMAHPTPYDISDVKNLAIHTMNVEFTGKESHASSAPWMGVNALDAVVASYNNISLFRQQMKPSWRVHGIVTKGGVKPNIIPANTGLQYYVRAPTMEELSTFKKDVTRCLEAGSLATGCSMKIEPEGPDYENLLGVKLMQDLYHKNAESLGVVFPKLDNPDMGSTDMGNVSHLIPSIHPMFSIGAKAFNHTKEFAAAAIDPKAQGPTLIAAEALALTALQIYLSSDLQKEIKIAFEKAKLNP